MNDPDKQLSPEDQKKAEELRAIYERFSRNNEKMLEMLDKLKAAHDKISKYIETGLKAYP